MNTWTRPSCKDWLKARGYVHNGNRSVLRGYITQLKRNRNDPPTLLDHDSSTVSEVNECIGSFFVNGVFYNG